MLAVHLVAVVWQLSGLAITNDLLSVNQRLMSPYFGDLADWLCKAFCWVSQMASSYISSFISQMASSHISSFTSQYLVVSSDGLF